MIDIKGRPWRNLDASCEWEAKQGSFQSNKVSLKFVQMIGKPW